MTLQKKKTLIRDTAKSEQKRTLEDRIADLEKAVEKLQGR